MLRRVLDHAVEGALLVLTVVLCVDVFLGVFSRYVLVRTFTWYDEIARLAFVWIVFLGAALAVKRADHFRLHLVVDRFPVPLQRVATLIGVLTVLGIGLLLVQQGWILVQFGQFQQTPVMGLPKSYVYGSMPVGGLLMVVYSLPLLWRALTRR